MKRVTQGVLIGAAMGKRIKCFAASRGFRGAKAFAFEIYKPEQPAHGPILSILKQSE